MMINSEWNSQNAPKLKLFLPEINKRNKFSDIYWGTSSWKSRYQSASYKIMNTEASSHMKKKQHKITLEI